MSKREERIQNLAAGLLIAGRTPADALAQSALFVQLCEARDAAESEAEAEEEEAEAEPEEDPEVALYVNAVRELVPGADRNIVINLYRNKYTPQGAAVWLRAYENYMERPTIP